MADKDKKKKTKIEDTELPDPAIATDDDFDSFAEQLLNDAPWDLVVDKDDVKVWDQKQEKSDINKVKLRVTFKGVDPLVLYDVFHDPKYRRVWDENMVDGYEFEQLDANNDVGYYAVKCPNPLSNRDFVNQRSWRVKGDQYIIFNHSVKYPACPEKKGFVRARSLITGYMVTKIEGGCVLNYMTQSDPKGHIPSVLSNSVTKKLAPQIVQKIANAAKGYPEWKAKNDPESHPWRSNVTPS